MRASNPLLFLGAAHAATSALLVAACSLNTNGLGTGGSSSTPTGAGGGGAASMSSSSNTGTGGMSGTGGMTGTGGMSGTGGTSGTGGGCPTGKGPTMVVVQAGNVAFCIDTTEVTVGQYKQFLGTNPAGNATGIQACDWNSKYQPEMVNQCKPEHLQNAPNDSPVVCIDWCDAYAYCKWAGKRLCGKLGGGGPAAFDQYANSTESEWMRACSEGGTKAYPYGSTYDKTACETDDSDGQSGNGDVQNPVAVRSHASCVGGYAGLYDMSGNVWEWENACENNMGEGDWCRARGGSFWDSTQDDNNPWLACGGPTFPGHNRGFANKNIGFRCCADVMP